MTATHADTRQTRAARAVARGRPSARLKKNVWPATYWAGDSRYRALVAETTIRRSLIATGSVDTAFPAGQKPDPGAATECRTARFPNRAAAERRATAQSSESRRPNAAHREHRPRSQRAALRASGITSNLAGATTHHRSPAAARRQSESLRTGASTHACPAAPPRTSAVKLLQSQKNTAASMVASRRSRSVLYEAQHQGSSCPNPFDTSD